MYPPHPRSAADGASPPPVDIAPDAVLGSLSGVAQEQALSALATELGELRDWLREDLAQLEAALQACFAGAPADPVGAPRADLLPTELPGTRVRDAASHLLRLPGKRIRPLCVLLAARLGGRSLDSTLRHVAVACELVHAATLLHDDVIDDSTERRGAPAARVLYGNSASILAGDHLLVYALQLVVGEQQAWLTHSLLEVMAGMVAAEALQLERRGRFEPRRDIYLQVIRGKTAALFAWGLQAGGRLADLPPESGRALEKVGRYLGMAFQLVDDSLDLAGDPQRIGKEVLRDLRDGKLTWPIILAAEADPSLRSHLEKLTASSQTPLDPAALAPVLQAVQASDALRQTKKFAEEMAACAVEALQELPDSPARQALELLIRSAVSRVA
jgi:octaprenyl-diphosphate synthase